MEKVQYLSLMSKFLPLWMDSWPISRDAVLKGDAHISPVVFQIVLPLQWHNEVNTSFLDHPGCLMLCSLLAALEFGKILVCEFGPKPCAHIPWICIYKSGSHHNGKLSVLCHWSSYIYVSGSLWERVAMVGYWILILMCP